MLILIREISNRMRRILQLYKNAFSGLTRSAWMLSVVMLINRSGTMVLPFLSIYLTSSLGFSLEQSGLILSCFGIGSMAGAFLGGWLTDKFGHFYVQFLSLVLGGVLFIILAYVDGYYQLATWHTYTEYRCRKLQACQLCISILLRKTRKCFTGIFTQSDGHQSRFFSRSCLGGLLAAISFKWLFIADGTTCILAGLFFFFYFRNVKGHEPKKQKKDPALPKSKSAWKDYGFLVFTLLTSCFAVLFFQLFTTLPLYYREVYSLSEGRIGLLLGLNGLVVFGMEMIMVYLLGRAFRIENLIFTGLVLIGVGFLVLNMVHAEYILFLGMIILSIAEIFAMPFMVTFVVQRSDLANRGAYMGLYSFAYAVGHVFSPIMGTFIIGRYGFDSLWWVSGFTAVAVGLGFWFVTRKTP
jgi:predicted MFS family arabinose efflux permease